MILSVGVAVQVIEGFSVTAVTEFGATEKYDKQLKHGCCLLVGSVYFFVCSEDLLAITYSKIKCSHHDNSSNIYAGLITNFTVSLHYAPSIPAAL